MLILKKICKIFTKSTIPDKKSTTISIITTALISYSIVLFISIIHDLLFDQPFPYKGLFLIYNLFFFLSYFIIKKIHFGAGLHLFMLTMFFSVLTFDLSHSGFQDLTILLYFYPIALCIFLFNSPSSWAFSFLFGLSFIGRTILISDHSYVEIKIMALFLFLALFSLISIKRWLVSLKYQKVESMKKVHMATLNILANVSEIKDKETHAHLKRVSGIIEVIARELKGISPYSHYITEKYIRDLKTAASLHDIGKIGISDSIILKDGMLDDDEFEEIKKHTIIGYNLLAQARIDAGQESFYDIAIEIVRHHHEKWDGTGYPDGLREHEIPLSARIMAIVDVYDALISHRSYKESYSHEEAFRIIQEESGTHFDPVLVAAFAKKTIEIKKQANVVREKRIKVFL